VRSLLIGGCRISPPPRKPRCAQPYAPAFGAAFFGRFAEVGLRVRIQEQRPARLLGEVEVPDE